MLKKNILIISPAYPPAINGLGDYAFNLGQNISKETNLTIYYAGLAQKEQVNLLNYIEINARNTLEQIVKEYLISLVFLNYSNYGYQKRGVPFWLLKSLLLINEQNVALVTFFHEIYASGKFWQSSFWLKPAQVFLFKRIYRLSTNVFCSNDVVLNLINLQVEDKGLKAKNIGIFSNIPQVEKLISWENRKPYGVIFGTLGRRKSIYNEINTLNSFIAHHKLIKIFDIGEGEINFEGMQISIPIIKCGKIKHDAISDILKECKWGFIDYPNKLLGKSGIFAAYCAFGLAVLNFSNELNGDSDQLTVEENFLVKDSDFSKNNGFILSENNINWYLKRNLNTHAQNVLKTINTINR